MTTQEMHSKERKMAPAPVAVSNEIEVLRHQARVTQRVMRLNVEGISHEESLIQPQPAGNCLNWVIGHLVFAYELIFPLLGQKPVMGEGRLNPTRAIRLRSRIRRGRALAGTFGRFRQSVERVDAGLARSRQESWMSRRRTRRQTIRRKRCARFWRVSRSIRLIARQTGLLRRVAGKPGAIA